MRNDKFSIILPCYNVSKYLRETLNSVLEQTFPAWECICVDDGSTDGTGSILDDYARRDDRIRVIHKENEGVCAARNDAIRVAKGEYVCFLDGDDVWTPEWLARMAEATQNGRVDVVRMQFSFWREDEGAARLMCDVKSKLTLFEGFDKVMKWGWITYTTDGYIWLNAVRRELLVRNHIRFPGGMKINEDIIFNLKVLPFAKSAVQCSYAGYFYRMRATSAWHSKRPIEGCTRYIAECNHLWLESRSVLERLECIDMVRRNQAFMIWCSLVQWIEFGVEDERKRGGEIIRELRIAWQGGMLDMRSIPFYWRPVFWATCRFGWIFPMYATFRVLDVYHRVHRKFLMLKGSERRNG